MPSHSLWVSRALIAVAAGEEFTHKELEEQLQSEASRRQDLVGQIAELQAMLDNASKQLHQVCAGHSSGHDIAQNCLSFASVEHSNNSSGGSRERGQVTLTEGLPPAVRPSQPTAA